MSEKKKVSLFKMVTFTVCGIVVLDTFVAPAVLGISSITLWIFTALLFFIPYGLINAELGSAYPDDGGLYIWIKEATNNLHASIAGWFYWVNVGMWMPAVFIAFTTWFSYAFFPDLGTWPSIAIAVGMSWLIVWIGIRGIDLGITLTNIAAFAKVFVLLIFGILGLVYAFQNGTANDFANINNWIPDFTNFETIGFISAIVYNLLGFELISSIASEIEEPQKNIPKMTIMAGILIAAVYIIGTFGVLVATPAAEIDPLDGFYLGLFELTSVLGGWQEIGFKFIIIITLFTLVSNMISWTLGASEVLGVVDFAKKSPLLSHRHPKYNTLSRSYIILGTISTALILLNYGLTGDANDAFWTILAFSFVIFLIPYLYLSYAVVKLRLRDGSENRQYKIPGGNFGLYFSAIANFIFIGGSIFLLFYTGEWDTLYHLTLIIGTLITTLMGIYFYKVAKLEE